MSTYKGIQGYKIEVVSSDPSNLQAGQIWYNTTSGALKFYNGSTTKTITVS